ncbi:hypothetical protein VTN02DRAFT_1109 [Thermoascus thermophilus]
MHSWDGALLLPPQRLYASPSQRRWRVSRAGKPQHHTLSQAVKSSGAGAKAGWASRRRSLRPGSSLG